MDSLFSFPVGLLHPLVGSRTGAMLRRYSLSVAPRFLWECLISRTVSSFSSPRLIKPIVPISGNGLTCSLRVKGYETAPAGEAFGSGPSR